MHTLPAPGAAAAVVTLPVQPARPPGRVSSNDTLRLASITACLLALLWLWELSGLDIPLARLSGGPAGFALRENWLLSTVFHQGGRGLSWALALALCLRPTVASATASPPAMRRRRLPSSMATSHSASPRPQWPGDGWCWP